MSGDKELVTAQVLAEALDLSVETIWRYTREKKIPCVELGNKQYRYKLADVISALVAAGMDEDVVVHPDFAGLAIALKTLWQT
ncbi:MAG: helix-turn-helix domain-containing protein [Bacillota bacterium]